MQRKMASATASRSRPYRTQRIPRFRMESSLARFGVNALGRRTMYIWHQQAATNEVQSLVFRARVCSLNRARIALGRLGECAHSDTILVEMTCPFGQLCVDFHPGI